MRGGPAYPMSQVPMTVLLKATIAEATVKVDFPPRLQRR